MSLISGSNSRLLATGGAALLRADMVEKEAAVAVRGVLRFVCALRRAIGLIALLTTPDRCRRVRDAVLHRLRLKADILQLASAVLDDFNAAAGQREVVLGVSRRSFVFQQQRVSTWATLGLQISEVGHAVVNRGCTVVGDRRLGHSRWSASRRRCTCLDIPIRLPTRI